MIQEGVALHGVGGTTLDANLETRAYLDEMAWSDGNGGTDASGGGCSSLFPRPAYQDRVARIGATRGVPDVAANADSPMAAKDVPPAILRLRTG